MTTRGEQTRQHLLDVAEQLLATRGVHAVSLREIRIAAGARNTAAMQFHFGDRDGPVDALMARHMPRIGELQQETYDRMVAEGRSDERRALVEVLVRPSAEYLSWGPSERSWVRIMAELSSMPDLRAREMRSIAPAPAVEVGGHLYNQLCDTMPRSLAAHRMVLLAQGALQMCADRARLVNDNSADLTLPSPVFIENLTDMIEASLFAPVSPPTARSLAEANTVPRRRRGTTPVPTPG